LFAVQVESYHHFSPSLARESMTHKQNKIIPRFCTILGVTRIPLEMNSSFHFILKWLSLLKPCYKIIDQLHLEHLDREFVVFPCCTTCSFIHSPIIVWTLMCKTSREYMIPLRWPLDYEYIQLGPSTWPFTLWYHDLCILFLFNKLANCINFIRLLQT
jgi:hypothetical protein